MCPIPNLHAFQADLIRIDRKHRILKEHLATQKRVLHPATSDIPRKPNAIDAGISRRMQKLAAVDVNTLEPRELAHGRRSASREGWVRRAVTQRRPPIDLHVPGIGLVSAHRSGARRRLNVT